MHCLVMIDGNLLKKLIESPPDGYGWSAKQTELKTTDARLNIAFTEEVIDGWVVIVYGEPDQKRDCIKSYISDLITRRLKGRELNELTVFFHFTNVLREPPPDRVSQLPYDDLEKTLETYVDASCHIQVWGYHRVSGIGDVIAKLPEYVNDPTGSLDSFIEEAKKRLQAVEEGKKSKLLSILKHRIEHFFLPTVIDLQGIGDELEIEYQRADEYLREVFEIRINSAFERDKAGEEYLYYRNRLNRARYLATGNSLDVSTLTMNEQRALEDWQRSTDTYVEARLPDEKSIWDLTRSAVNTEVGEYWKEISRLIGLCYDEPSGKFAHCGDSSMYQYMERMDNWLSKCDTETKAGKQHVTRLAVSAQEVVDLANEFGTDGLGPKCFADWFMSLGNAMNELRNRLGTDLPLSENEETTNS